MHHLVLRQLPTLDLLALLRAGAHVPAMIEILDRIDDPVTSRDTMRTIARSLPIGDLVASVRALVDAALAGERAAVAAVARHVHGPARGPARRLVRLAVPRADLERISARLRAGKSPQ